VTSVVGDTHALLWYLLDDPRLSSAAVAAFDGATKAGRTIYVPSMCIVEATYLVEKGRIVPAALAVMDDVLGDPASPLRMIELNHAVATAVRRVSRQAVPDLPDRVIAATALALGLPLITRDGKIRASGIETIW